MRHDRLDRGGGEGDHHHHHHSPYQAIETLHDLQQSSMAACIRDVMSVHDFLYREVSSLLLGWPIQQTEFVFHIVARKAREKNTLWTHEGHFTERCRNECLVIHWVWSLLASLPWSGQDNTQ